MNGDMDEATTGGWVYGRQKEERPKEQLAGFDDNSGNTYLEEVPVRQYCKGND